MALSRDTLHLLLLTRTQNDAEQLISLIRQSGFSTRAQSVTSHEQFGEALNAANWDVVVADPDLKDIDFSELLNQIHRLNLDVPLVLIPEETNPMLLETALLKGAAAVVPVEESNSLVLTIRREIDNLRTRQDVRLLKVRLREAEKRSRVLLESSRDPIAYVHDGMHVYANQAYLELFGYPSVDELEGMPVMDMIAADSQQAFKDFLKQYKGAIPEGHQLNITGILPDGAQFPMQMSFTDATYGDEPCTQIQIARRDSNEKLEAELTELRNRDTTTNLFSKEYFLSRLARATDQAVLEKQFSTLMYICIDGFDNFKREIGIQSADIVVKEVSNCLSAVAKEYDITARLGDEVFAWMMPGGDPEKAKDLAEQLLHSVSQLMLDFEQRTVQPTVSIGIALITDASPTPDEVLQQAHYAADAVLSDEKTPNGNGLHLYMPADKAEVRQTRSLEKVIIDALRRNRMRLVFQPLISMRGEEAEHYEVLLRLPMDDNTEMMAGDFINSTDISDELKRKLDRWVILHATKLLSGRQRQGHDTRLFINITGASIRDEGLPAWVQVALKAAELKHNSIIFQISEEDAVRYTAPAKRFCYQIRACGISTAVNHFGCELEPMKLLKSIDVDYVKIDGSYSRDLGSSSTSGKALKELLQGAHEAGKMSIVPFVESASSVSAIWQYGVHFIQGYYVQAPQAGMNYDFSEE